MTIALGIPHCTWIPERVASMEALRETISRNADFDREFIDREPNWSWAERLWRWGYETGADHLLQLQDDVIVDAQFWPNLRAMLAAVPDQIVGLETVHPAAKMLYESGQSWCTTSDGLIGVGYVIPRDVLKTFLEWRVSEVRAEGWKQVSEDTLIDMFCLSTKRRVWHPIPTIIDHDVSMASTYQNDSHTFRRPAVTTVRGAKAGDWTPRNVPHLGRFYELTARACRRHVRHFHAEDMIAALADRGS